MDFAKLLLWNEDVNVSIKKGMRAMGHAEERIKS